MTGEALARAAVLGLVNTWAMPETAGKGPGAFELREDDPSPACPAPRRCASQGEDVEDGSLMQAEYERRLGERPSSPMRLKESSKDETASQELGQSPAPAQEQPASLARSLYMDKLGESHAPVQEQAASLARSDSVVSTSPHSSDESWGKVVVSRFPAFKVQSADMRWLRLFGFSASDVERRSLRIATGPKTKMQVLSQLCSILPGAKASPLEFATMYKKSGDMISVMIRATLEPVEEGTISLGNISLEMRPLDASGSNAPEDDLEGATIPQENFEEEAAVRLSSEAPHIVSRVNAQCEALLGVTESRLKERGLADMFSAQTSHTRWKNLIKGAAEGATRSCLMSLRGGNYNDIAVVMEVSPDTATPRVASLYQHVVVKMRPSLDASPPDSDASPPGSATSDASWCSSGAPSCISTGELARGAFARATSSGSVCSVSSLASGQGGGVSRAPSEVARAPSQGALLDTMANTQNAHLRAFVAARQRKKKEEEARRASAEPLAEGSSSSVEAP